MTRNFSTKIPGFTMWNPALQKWKWWYQCSWSRILWNESPHQELPSLVLKKTEPLQAWFQGPRSCGTELDSGLRPPVCPSPLCRLQTLPSGGSFITSTSLQQPLPGKLGSLGLPCVPEPEDELGLAFGFQPVLQSLHNSALQFGFESICSGSYIFVAVGLFGLCIMLGLFSVILVLSFVLLLFIFFSTSNR